MNHAIAVIKSTQPNTVDVIMSSRFPTLAFKKANKNSEIVIFLNHFCFSRNIYQIHFWNKKCVSIYYHLL